MNSYATRWWRVCLLAGLLSACTAAPGDRLSAQLAPTSQPAGFPTRSVPAVSPAAPSLMPGATTTALPPAATATRVPTAAPPTATPAPTATPPPSPTQGPLQISGYLAHMLKEGQTLERLAEQAGSDADVIMRYNRLSSPPQPGRELIIPILDGRVSQLESEILVVERGNTRQPWVALTFDAAFISAPTPQILETLRRRGIRLTFFLTGLWMSENPALVRQIVADGHEIANHSFEHASFIKLSDAEIEAELAATEAVLHAIAGPEVSIRPYFRPPYGDFDQRVLQRVIELGYLPIYWTLDSRDALGELKTPAYLVERVTTTLSRDELAGAIILVHLGSQPTADALPVILDRFAALGLEVRTLSEVLGP